MKKLTKEIFIEKAKSIHGDKYDYSKVDYVNNHTKVCIICPKHGEFFMTPSAHINQKQGCMFCSGKKLNTDIFIEKAKSVHGDKYDYSKVDYKDNHTKVCIVCPKHGEFWQKPQNHLRGQNCPSCANQYSPTTDEWIERAKKVHGDKFDYSKVKYVNTVTRLTIICPKHGEFLTYPNSHLNGLGCPMCGISKLEAIIFKALSDRKITFTYLKRFDWLKNKKKLSLDFYLPDQKIAIECQGEQHLIRERAFGEKTQYENDLLKNRLCAEHGIKLYYFGSVDMNEINVNNMLYNENTYYTKSKYLLNKI